MTSAWSIRWRLTAWYIAVLSVILVIFGGLMSAMMSRQLHRRIDKELAEEATELAAELRALPSTDGVRAVFNRHYVEHGEFSFQVSRADGSVVCGSPWLRAHTLPKLLSNQQNEFGSWQDLSLRNLGLHRLFLRRIQGYPESLTIYVLVPYALSQREFREFAKILIVAGFVALLVACAGGLLIARRALQPLERITRAAERISAENLTMSIAVENPRDELGRLAKTLNDTFARLRFSVHQMQRFTADAAHELRTPLSVLRTRLEVALRSPIDAGQLQESSQVALQQTETLTRLIDQLLMLSRQDAGLSKLLFEEVYLQPLLTDVVEILGTAARDKGVSLTMGEIPNGVVLGDDISLSRLFFNLIDNAIKYTPAGGGVQLTGCCQDHRIRVMVCDTGIGMDADQLPKVFDRFYRADPSRNEQTGGTGLGLAICRSIVESHQGEISVSSRIGAGTTFTVVLPLVDEAVTGNTLIEEQHARSSRSQVGQLS